MRNLLLLGIVAIAAFMAGWFTISRDGEHTTIQFNRDEIRNDTKVAIDRGREILNKQLPPQTQGVPAQYTPQPGQYSQPDPYAQPYPQNYAPSPQQPGPYQYLPADRTAVNPQADWNQQRSNYPPVQPASAQPTQWQQPPQYPASQYPASQSPASQSPASQSPASQYQASPYRAQPAGYQVPRQY